jgi:hypothetical protein
MTDFTHIFTPKEFDAVNGSFDNLLGRLAGFLGVDSDEHEAIESELLDIIERHGGEPGKTFAQKRRA